MYYNRIRPSLYLPDVYAEIFAIACNMVTKPMKHTDETPGLKITPVVVLGMSVCFIGFVTMLHAIAKISAYTSGK